VVFYQITKRRAGACQTRKENMKTKIITLLASIAFLSSNLAYGSQPEAKMVAQKSAKKKALSPKMKKALALGDEMLGHISAMFKLLDGDKAKCKQSIAAVKKYVEKNKSKLTVLKDKMLKMENQFSEKEQEILKEVMMEKTQKYMQEVMSTMMAFSQNCPEQAAQLGQVMSVFSVGEKPGGAPPQPPAKTPGKTKK